MVNRTHGGSMAGACLLIGLLGPVGGCSGSPVEAGGYTGHHQSSNGASGSDTGTGDGSSTGHQTTSTTSNGSNDTPQCGNGKVEPGEACDDGNDNDRDSCTSMCRSPVCNDGILDGMETDVDCGGNCQPCSEGAGCEQAVDCQTALVCDETSSQCAMPKSCLQLHGAWPDLLDGTYTIDPDGSGTKLPFDVPCDMTGGGWTQITSDAFEAPPQGWSDDTTSTCGAFGSLLGGAGLFGNGSDDIGVDLRGVPHVSVRLTGHFVVIDSWDSETAYATVDGAMVWTHQCFYGDSTTCGQSANQCGDPGYPDGLIAVSGMADHLDAKASVGFGAVLDELPDNESWGLQDFAVWVR